MLDRRARNAREHRMHGPEKSEQEGANEDQASHGNKPRQASYHGVPSAPTFGLPAYVNPVAVLSTPIGPWPVQLSRSPASDHRLGRVAGMTRPSRSRPPQLFSRVVDARRWCAHDSQYIVRNGLPLTLLEFRSNAVPPERTGR